MDKLVSIAMITYNHSNFIKEAIDSCLNQTYKNIEICIGDDCSNDGTTEIIKDYQSKFPNKIKIYFQNENMGKYTYAINFNCMYNLCSGDYIAILEGDDIMLPNRIENQVKFLDENPDCIAVTHNFETFNNDTQEIIENIFPNLKTENRTTKFLIRNGNHVHTPTVMMRNVKDKVQTNYSLKGMLDWLFFIELSMLGKIGHQDLILTRYRKHNDGASNNKSLIFHDHDMTLAIVEIKYPQYINDVIYGKTRFYIDRIAQGKNLYYKAIFFPHFIVSFYILTLKIFSKIKRNLLN